MSDFSTRDPSLPAFWDERFARGFTPWDAGDTAAELRHFIARASQPMSVLIPGCGAAREVASLSEAGWEVVAIDFSPAAVTQARALLGPWAERVIEADFFTYQPPRAPDLIYERAFLCALRPDWWPRIVARWAELLPAGGLLAGFFFFDQTAKGPPFGADENALRALLSPHFERIEDAPAQSSVAVFAGRERWQVWRRRG